MNDNLINKYSLFADLLEKGKIYLDPEVDFPEVCRRLEVASRDMDDLLQEELGMTGDEVLSAYRRIAVDAVSNLH